MVNVTPRAPTYSVMLRYQGDPDGSSFGVMVAVACSADPERQISLAVAAALSERSIRPSPAGEVEVVEVRRCGHTLLVTEGEG